MSTQTLHLASSLSGNMQNPGNALGNTPATWAGVLNANTSVTHEWAFTDPTLGKKAPQQQTVTAVFRKGTNSGNPTVRINVLRAGQTIATAAATVTSTVGQTITATWTPASGASSQGVTLQVVVTAAGGSPSARNSAQMSMATWTAQTVAANQPPVAVASGSSSVEVGQEATLDGSGSYDPDGTVTGWAWTQTSGDPVTMSGTGAVRTFTPSTEGDRGFSLVVTDNAGASSAPAAWTVGATEPEGPPPSGAPPGWIGVPHDGTLKKVPLKIFHGGVWKQVPLMVNPTGSAWRMTAGDPTPAGVYDESLYDEAIYQ